MRQSSSSKYNYQDNSASSSKLNKSVTFNNQVRVREYGDAAKLNALNSSQYATPSKNLYNNFNQASRLDYTPSPIRK
jgi:hypothetical protein